MDSPDPILCGRSRGILSLVGGGGKTSLMFHLARLLAGTGKRVLTTTTTKIFRPEREQSSTVLIDPDPDRVLARAKDLIPGTKHLTATSSVLADGDKLQGFDPAVIEHFDRSGLFDWIIVEADGSARRPLKAPADHEPVIPPATSILVAVAGLDVLGEPLTEEMVFRLEIAAERMGLRPGDPVSEASVARLAAHPEGFFKGAPPEATRLIFLNKADDLGRRTGGDRIAGLLRRASPPPADRLLIGQALPELVIHAIHPLKEERCAPETG